MERKKHSLNFELSGTPSEAGNQCTENNAGIDSPASQIDHLIRRSQIQAILEESDRWLNFDWVQKKLARRWATILEGRSEPFSL